MILCERHGRIRCDECAFVDELKERIAELQKALEQIYHLRPVACGWTDEEYYEKFTECEDIAREALERRKSQ